MLTSSRLGRRHWALPQGSLEMSIAPRVDPAREPFSDHEQKQIALSYLLEAWNAYARRLRRGQGFPTVIPAEPTGPRECAGPMTGSARAGIHNQTSFDFSRG